MQDLENKPEGFNMNGAGTNVQFQYDDYGNLTSDPYKKISNISYNHLSTSTALSTGLPIKITFSSGGKIEYFYDATGGKLKKKVTDGSTITTTDYMDTSATLSTGGFQYTDTKLDFFPHTSTGLSTSAAGYIKAVYGDLGGGGPPSFKYVFTYTDHTSTQLSTGLGNIRLKYAQHPQTGETTILEEDHYYPYGLKHNGYNGEHTVIAYEEDVITLTPVTALFGDSYKYKFGGKEYDDTFDINTYAFGARNYDPALGRWLNVDPLAERYITNSPYVFTANNPIFNMEIDGRYFEGRDERRADRLERRADRRAEKLSSKADRLEAKGKSAGDLRERAGELTQSANDIRDMQGNENTQFRYASTNSKEAKSLGLGGKPATTGTDKNGNAVINDNGHNVVTMFTGSKTGQKLHETRHGGQPSRGEINAITQVRGLDAEVSAYRAEYSWSGSLNYLSHNVDQTSILNRALLDGKSYNFALKNILNINQINLNVVRDIGKVFDASSLNLPGYNGNWILPLYSN